MHTSKKRLSKNFIFLAFLVCSALIFWASCAFGAVVSGTDYTWIKGSDGNWNESTSWNPEGVPNGSGDTATVDTATDVTVTMNGSYTLGGLTVGSGDRVLIDNAQTLIVGASASGGTIINNGTILLDATAGYTHLRANGVVTLDGSGSVELGHDTFAQLDRDGT
ncbi:MAG: hypothetical protein LJE96_06705, partial [Deltaproteobacteria bacterium]|nr:hypothetical protein [Deltaproteobacteria bacterium]